MHPPSHADTAVGMSRDKAGIPSIAWRPQWQPAPPGAASGVLSPRPHTSPGGPGACSGKTDTGLGTTGTSATVGSGFGARLKLAEHGGEASISHHSPCRQ